MRWWLTFLPLALACTTTQVVPLTPTKHQPRPKDHPIQFYSSKVPTCPFEELGIVTARRDSWLVSMNAVSDALRKKAREVGGDALVRVAFIDDGSGISGTVIRFKGNDCTQ